MLPEAAEDVSELGGFGRISFCFAEVPFLPREAASEIPSA